MQEVDGLYSECPERTRKSTVKDKGGERETTATTNGNNVVTTTRAKCSVLPVCVTRFAASREPKRRLIGIIKLKRRQRQSLIYIFK